MSSLTVLADPDRSAVASGKLTAICLGSAMSSVAERPFMMKRFGR